MNDFFPQKNSINDWLHLNICSTQLKVNTVVESDANVLKNNLIYSHSTFLDAGKGQNKYFVTGENYIKRKFHCPQVKYQNTVVFHSFTCCLWLSLYDNGMAELLQHRHCYMDFAAETICPERPNMFIIWPFTKNVC